MRKILFFLLLLAVFLLALAVEWNTRQESKSARLGTVPPEVRGDDVIEVVIGHPAGRSRAGGQRAAPSTKPREGRNPAARPVADSASREAESGKTAAGAPGKGPKKRKYVIQKGDTLSGIAAKLLGDESKASLLIEWNHLRNPDLILPGDTLVYYK